MQAEGRADSLAARPRTLLYLTAAIAVLADQATKALALAQLTDGESVPFIRNVWHWTLHRNPGAAFSLLTEYPALFTALAAIIAIVIVVYSFRTRDLMQATALGLVLGGALGNLTDRIARPPAPFRGHVIDFIDWRVWPTFNLADVSIVCGAALLFIWSVREDRAAKAAASA